MDVLEILIEARALIEGPARWTQGCFARNQSWYPVSVNEGDASCWCSIGALRRVNRGLSPTVIEAESLLDRCSGGDMVKFNDTSSHAEVLEVFDAAIERARDGYY